MSILTGKLSLAETQAQVHLQEQQELGQKLIKAEQLLLEKNGKIEALESSLQRKTDLVGKLEGQIRTEGEKHSAALSWKGERICRANQKDKGSGGAVAVWKEECRDGISNR